jgi:alcohol dehydrogenase class IV
MRTFDFYCLPHVVFGRGCILRLPGLVQGLGRSALLIHNAGDAAGGPVDRVVRVLDSAGVRVTIIEQRGEPKVEDVDSAVAAAREAGCDVVIGLGGGSAIDSAKAVAGLLTNGGSAMDYMEVVGRGVKIGKPAAPWIAMPTTAGTGAEATRNAVIGCPEKKFKASIRSEHLLATVALVDPELGVDVPPEVTAASGMDALCQVIESYTSAGAQPMTDALAIKGIELAARSLRRAFEDGHDLDAREDMAMAALLSGITLANAGLGAVHGFAAPLGANFPVPHGAACAVLLPPVIEANVTALRAAGNAAGLARYAAIGRIVSGKSDLADESAIDALIRFVSDLVRDLRIPPLSQYGLGGGHVPEMVALARKASSMKYNPVALSDAALSQVLQKGIGGA